MWCEELLVHRCNGFPRRCTRCIRRAFQTFVDFGIAVKVRQSQIPSGAVAAVIGLVMIAAAFGLLSLVEPILRDTLLQCRAIRIEEELEIGITSLLVGQVFSEL